MLDWSRIDTVLLDMDGTLLDLHYDATFWLQHLPTRFADHHGLTAAEAEARLRPLFERSRKRLEFYCLDWWSEQTGLDIITLKHELAHLIRYRPTAHGFLQDVRRSGRRLVIVTNAHRAGLELKHRHTGIIDHVDTVISAHDYRLPKEAPEFWQRAGHALALEPATTLLVDDNLDALEAASACGIAHCFAVAQPDSSQAPLRGLRYPALDDFTALGPVLPRKEPR